MGASKTQFMNDRCVNYDNDDLLNDIYSQSKN